jgi:dihydrodipicolinate synthase/N-acetylneuraminate lyase
MTEYQGIYTAPITPMTADHELNEGVMREIIEFHVVAGVDGFWVAGGSGESILLDDDENHRIAALVADQVAGRAKVIMHVGAATTKRAARNAEAAARGGVDAICCIPPFFYRQTDAAVVEHYRVVAAAAALPFFSYNLPQMTQCEITAPLMAKIQDAVPQLKGVKHSGPNFANVRAFTTMGLDCFIGLSPLMLPALAAGAVGCVDGWPGIAPEIWVELWRAWQAGDMAGAQAAQDRGIAVAKLGEIGHFHGILKAATGYRLGLDCGTPRPPGLPLSADQDRALRQRLAELDLLPAARAAE